MIMCKSYVLQLLFSSSNMKKGASGKSEHISPPLEWCQRIKIVVDTAKGLEYHHEKAHPSIVHGDKRPSNILLSENHKAKIADEVLFFLK